MAGVTPTQLPAYIQLRYEENGVFNTIQRDASNVARTTRTTLDSAFAGAAQNAQTEFDRAFASIDATISKALSRPRGAGGSLDLGVDEMNRAARAQEARATAAQEAAAAVRAAAAAEGDYSAKARTAIAAADALAVQERNAAQAARDQADALEQVQRQLDRHASATDVVVGSSRRLVGANDNVRHSTMNATQQMQDMAISLYSGQRAGTVFAQQLPQLAFALSGLEGSANKTLGRLGKFGTFMSGPWGLLVGLGIGVLVTLATRLFETDDAAEKATGSVGDLANKLDLTKNSYESLTAVVKAYNDEQSHSTALTYQAILAAEEKARANLKEAKSILAKMDAANIAPGAGEFAQGYATSSARSGLAGRISDLQKQLNEAGMAAGTERVRREFDKRYNIEVGYNEKIGKLEEDRKNGLIEQIAFEQQRLSLLNQQKAAMEAFDAAQKKTTASNRELADFISPIPGARISSGFGPRKSPTAGASSFHPAIDLAAPLGTPVRAPQVGVVEAVGFSSSLGKYVVINHGAGTKSRFGHLSDNSQVVKGQSVEQGAIIGKVGSTGISTGPHLDYQIKVNGKPVDPSKGKFPFDPVTAAEAGRKLAEETAKAQQVLEQYGASASESIARINERFDESPRLIDQAARATRDLDGTIAGLQEKLKDPNLAPGLAEGFRAAITEAEAAKDTIQDALFRPVQMARQESERRL